MKTLATKIEKEYEVDTKAEGYGIAIGVNGDWDAIFCDIHDDLEGVREDVESVIEGLGGDTGSEGCPSCGGPTSVQGEKCDSCR